MSSSSTPEPPKNSVDRDLLDNNLFVVGIGASAGGLSALEELFSHLRADSGAAFVVIQHLSPDFKSLMKELLERHTQMEVYRVTDGMELKPNSVFLIPPGKNLIVEANILKLQERKKIKNEINFPIDLFFTSLAKNYQERAIGVILSGSGSDGTHGLRSINEAGGIALVQEPATAQFDGMPLSAVATGVVNQILPVPELAKLIHQCIASPNYFSEAESSQDALLTSSSLKTIASILLNSEKIDFSQYKISTISRRIHRRRLINNFPDISSYIQVLKDSKEERRILCSDLLINVTHFFRDRFAWKVIENKVLPDIIKKAQPNTELRFWIAGCSTGQEAYSLAILVHEALQKDLKQLKVKIFATDIDRTALETASVGIYPRSIAKDISAERLQKYFVLNDNNYQITKKIRELLIFSCHNLAKDPVFTRLHFASCRNVLIYMQPNLQLQILRNFHFSLQPQGVLFLGEAESMGEYESEFTTLDKKWKIYQKLRNIRLPVTNYNLTKYSDSSIIRNYNPPLASQTKPIAELSLKRLLGQSNSVVLIVSHDNRLLHLYGDSSQVLKPQQGKIMTDVTQMVKKPLQLPFNAALNRAKKERKSVEYTSIKFKQSSENYQGNLTVIPPDSNHDDSDFYLVEIKIKAVVLSTEISPEQFQISSDEQRRVFALENELQHTRENLQALVEELETTNEEQQASNEELTASNEELQSTNEELHSVNEELHTVNVEYQSKISELIQLNNDIDNLLISTDIGVIFLDSEFNIRKFTPAATIAVSLRNTDLQRPLSELKLKIDCEDLEGLLVAVKLNHTTIEREVQLRSNSTYLLMRISPYQTGEKQYDGLVISFIGINEVKQVQLELENTLTELQSKETEISNFFELSLEIMCVAHQDGYFKRINPSFQSILGYSNQELLNKPFIDFVHPDDVEATLKAGENLSLGKKVTGFENRYRCQDGSYRWLKWMATSYKGLTYATAHDLTQQKLTQELQNRQLAAMETATDGIGILNEDKFIYVNQAHLDIFGYSQPEELLGQSWRILYQPKRLAEFDQEILPVLQDKGKWQGVVQAKHKDGHIFDEELTLNFSQTGDLIRVCQNISDRLEMQRSLVESEKKYRYLYENTPVMLHSVDSQGKILSASNYWLQHMGYSQKEVIGRQSTEFLTLESQEYAKKILPEFYRTGSCHNVFYQWVRKDGSIIDGLLSAISDMQNGKIVRSLAVIVDITEQRQKEKLEEANRAKDNFIAHMSHELRTPLNSIIGFSHILKKDSRLIPEQLKSIDLINQSGQHLLTLINDVLDLSKLNANKLELQYNDFDLNHFIYNIVNIFEIRAQEKGISFFTHTSKNIPVVVSTDETKLRQVLFNLLSNAVKFTSIGGGITFSVNDIVSSADSSMKTVRFEVEDTGIGIPENQYDHIFAPFGQLDQKNNDGEGTGLGLPICQNILNLMDSELYLDSKVGQGSHFWFDLQVQEVLEHDVSLPLENLSLVKIAHKLATPCKVLVVDDNTDNRFLLTDYLQGLGFTTTEAKNGQEGIAIALDFQPDVIVADLMMPVMNGKEMIVAIGQEELIKDTKVFIVSANISSIIDFSDIKCDGFLAKPIDLERLLELLEEHLPLNWQTFTEGSNLDDTNEEIELIYPAADKLVKLLESVTLGKMKKLRQQIESLEETDSQYIYFARKVRQLADNYEQNKLQKLLEQLIEQE